MTQVGRLTETSCIHIISKQFLSLLVMTIIIFIMITIMCVMNTIIIIMTIIIIIMITMNIVIEGIME